jgi:hypothetical protein
MREREQNKRQRPVDLGPRQVEVTTVAKGATGAREAKTRFVDVRRNGLPPPRMFLPART